MAPSMCDVFVSYKREEHEAVGLIVDRLRSLQLDVWFDAHLNQNTGYDEQIASNLTKAKCILVCWTPAAVTSDWVRSEATVGHDDGRMVACFLEPTKLPPPFNLHQSEDLMRCGGQDDDPAWLRLLAAIGERVSRPGISTYTAAMTPGAPVDRLRSWATAFGADPLATGVWSRIRLIEGESAADRIAREQLEAHNRNAKRLADVARSKALAKARGLRDPARERRRIALAFAGIIAVGFLAASGVAYVVDAQRRGHELDRAATPDSVRAFIAGNRWHPLAADARRKLETLDVGAWSTAR